jgi:Protein of unknown function (DUF4031)
MAVYVDDMHLTDMGRYRGMRMCHMLATTDDELHAMADRIGVSRRYWQSPEKTSGSHYDIAMSKRELAVRAGAIEITMRQMGLMNMMRRSSGVLPTPEEAAAWWASRNAEKNTQQP